MAAKKQAKAPWTWRGSVVVFVAVAGGLAIGALLGLLVPAGGILAADRARFHLVKDDASSLRDAADLANGDDVALNGIGALARVLLWLEHGADDATRATAETLLQKASAVTRVTPEALYARALLASLPREREPLVDAKLDDELNTAKATPWVQLGRALRSHDDDERRKLIEAAALGREPPLHATHLLARSMVAAGDLLSARAALDRLFRLAPRHAAGAITAVAVGLIEEATLPGEQRRAPREKNQGAPRPGEKSPVGKDEARARSLADDGLADDDEDQLVLLLLALDLARSGQPDEDLRARAVKAAERSRQNLERLLEIEVCAADVDGADAALAKMASATKSAPGASLLTDISRKRFLAAIPEDERRGLRNRAPKAVDDGPVAAGLQLPLCGLRFRFAHVAAEGHSVVDLGAPWQVMPDGAVFPERRYRKLIAGLEAGGKADKLDARLAAIEKLGLAERAAAAASYDKALAFVASARDQGGDEADISLVEGAVRQRQNDPVGARRALDAAVAAAPLDPQVLLDVVRLHVDADNAAGAKKTLALWSKLGLRSATATALEVIVAGRSGDVAAARAGLVEARKMAVDADTDPLMLRATIMANRQVDPGEARRASDRLLSLGAFGGGDVVLAWLAEAELRKGDTARAEAQLKAIVDAKPGIGEAHLFYASAIQFDPTRKKEAFKQAFKALETIPGGPLVDEAKKLALTLKKKK